MAELDVIPYLFFGGFVLVVFGISTYHRFIRPSLIPNAEITRIADELIERHGSRA